MHSQGSAATPDFGRIFEAVPAFYLVLAADPPRFSIVGASEAYLRATLTTREGSKSIIGRGLFEAFPDSPHLRDPTGVRNLRASLMRAFTSGAPDVMAVQHYDIRRPDGTWEERHWAPRNTPVLGPDMTVCYLLHEVEDVTRLVQAQKAEREAQVALDSARTALEAATGALTRERLLLRDADIQSRRLREESKALRNEIQTLMAHSEAIRSKSRNPRRPNQPEG